MMLDVFAFGMAIVCFAVLFFGWGTTKTR